MTDDGASTTSTTRLHAKWSSRDPESGIRGYRYLIRRDSPSGPILVTWTSTKATEVVRTGLTLTPGKSYWWGVKAKNGAGAWSTIGYSDGITVQPDTVAPTIQSISPAPSPSLYAGSVITLSASVTDSDPSPLEYQFSIDGAIVRPWSSATAYPWVTTGAMAGAHTITVEVRDAGGADAQTQTLYLYHPPPGSP